MADDRREPSSAPPLAHQAPSSAFWAETWADKAHALADAPLHVIDGYQFLDAGAYDAMIAAVTAPMRLSPGDEVVEIGCGSGAFLLALQRAVPGVRLHGVDVCEAMIEVARARTPSIPFAVGDVRHLGAIPDARFDHAAAFAVLCYLDDHGQAEAALDELVRIVRPGGCVFLGDTSDEAHVEASTAFLARAWAPRAIPPYLYFAPGWFARFARARGLGCEIVPMATLDLPTYAPRAFRFSVYLRRSE